MQSSVDLSFKLFTLVQQGKHFFSDLSESVYNSWTGVLTVMALKLIIIIMMMIISIEKYYELVDGGRKQMVAVVSLAQQL